MHNDIDIPTFNLRVFEDTILDRDELLEFLKTTAGQVNLDTLGEGPSLNECGLVDILNESGKPFSDIQVITPNEVEELPIKCTTNRIGNFTFNYWFGTVHRAYKKYTFKNLAQEHYRLGCFIGRKNSDRLAILYWLSRCTRTFLSSLREDHINHDRRPDLYRWVDNYDSFNEWVSKFNIPSIDNHSVNEQYQDIDLNVPNSKFLNVQLNMLNWYNGFDVELVCETFVRGDTYFPTEKTTRPIAGGKPMLIYGPKNFLARLRDQGFKTWGDCWDESYDEYEGLGRWMRIKEVIIQNNDWNVQEWKSIVKKANAIAQYNQEYFMREVANDYNY